MRLTDLLQLSSSAIRAQPGRSLLTGLGIAVGILAVVLLTAFGEGVQRFVIGQFTQFGTHLLAVTPGKSETLGLSGAVISTVRPLSLEDARQLRKLPQVEAVVPFVQGNAEVEWQGKSRRSNLFGTGAAVPQAWQIPVAQGRFLPDDDPRHARAYAVLGSKLRRELFGSHSPLGEKIRIGGESYRVIGSMRTKGQMLGFDLDDTVYIPVGRALAMFNREGLMEIDVLYSANAKADTVARHIRTRLMALHGREDFTIITQDQMLEVLGSVLEVLTFAVAALGAISLVVGGIGIFTIMTISVQERMHEVGLLRALGAPRRQIVALFLAESAALGSLGGLAGLGLGLGLAGLLQWLLPALPVHVAWDYVALSLGLSLLIGLLAGTVPALQAAGLNPVEALRSE